MRLLEWIDNCFSDLAAFVWASGTRRAGSETIVFECHRALSRGLVLWLALVPPAFAAIPASERSALMNLYASTGGSAWRHGASWNGAEGSECSWDGVGCDINQTTVTGLDLSANNVTGSLPDLSALTNLQEFHIGNNPIGGSLAAIAQLPNLKIFDSYSNQFTGSLPALNGLVHLQTFRAAGDRLTGSIPPLTGLTNLQSFSVGNNQLTGAVPVLDGLVALSSFAVGANKLTGPIPALSSAPNLEEVYLQQNQLTGTIPALSTLIHLQYFNASNNQLSGSVPSLDGLSSLQDFEVDSNLLVGSVPSLAGLSSLTTLKIQQNQLSGALPDPPSSLIAGQSSVCPNKLDGDANSSWDKATGISPWFANCVPGLSTYVVTPSVIGSAQNGLIDPYHAVTVTTGQTVTFNIFPNPSFIPQIGGTCGGTLSVAQGYTTYTTNPISADCTVEASFSVATTTTVSSDVNASIPGQSVAITATVSGSVGSGVGGTISFYDGETPICSDVPLLATNYVAASCATAALSLGTHIISATYSGDTQDLASTGSYAQEIENSTPAVIGGFIPLVPARLLDTRPGYATIDGQFAGIGPIGAQSALNFLYIGNRGGVPASGVDSVVLNITATEPTAPGFLTIWPNGSSRPLASNLNFLANETVQNLVVAKVGAFGGISIFNSAGATNVIADVEGYFTSASGLSSIVPERLLDTRSGGSTVDGRFAGSGAMQPQETLNFNVVGRPKVPGGGVRTVALNVTATNPSAAGYLTVWPAGASRPSTSNLNFTPGQTIPNIVITGVGEDGQISLFNSAGSTDVIADIVGWFPATPKLTTTTPSRLLDTRPGYKTIDGKFAGIGALAAQTSMGLTALGRGGVPATGVDAVILNVTVTNPTTSGFLSVWPSGTPRPLASNLNFSRGHTVANLVFAKIGANGQVSIFNSAGTVDVIADVVGWYPTDN